MNNINENFVKWIEEKGGDNIVIIDLTPFSTAFADNFIITSGRSDLQVQAIADNIQEKAREAGLSLNHREGDNSSKWILLDYYDTIIHIFHKSIRDFYNLERLWKEDNNITRV